MYTWPFPQVREGHRTKGRYGRSERRYARGPSKVSLRDCYKHLQTLESRRKQPCFRCASDMCAAERILVGQPFGALRAAERGL